jgi:hypothetical protein
MSERHLYLPTPFKRIVDAVSLIIGDAEQEVHERNVVI